MAETHTHTLAQGASLKTQFTNDRPYGAPVPFPFLSLCLSLDLYMGMLQLLCFFPGSNQQQLIVVTNCGKSYQWYYRRNQWTDRHSGREERERERELQPYASSITSGCSFNFNLPWPTADTDYASGGAGQCICLRLSLLLGIILI